MPIPKAPPKELPDEGEQYGFIKSTRIRASNVTIRKNTPDEEHGIVIFEVKVNTVVPDQSDHVDCECVGDIWIHTDEDYSDGNFAYERFLNAVGEEPIVISLPDGSEQEMLPDPEDDRWVGKLVKVRVKHKEWEYGGNSGTSASIIRWEPWDGTDPDTGEMLDLDLPAKDPWEESSYNETEERLEEADDDTVF